MEDQADNEMERALCDVRRAFRLLYDYNQRVRDVVAILADMLPGWSIQQTFSGTPISARRPVAGAWTSWDCAPTIGWTFLFMSQQQSGQKSFEVCLALSFRADTGYDDAEDDDVDPGKLPPADQCDSIVQLSCLTAPQDPNHDWMTIWHDTDFGEQANVFEPLIGARGVKAYWTQRRLVELSDEAAVRKEFNAVFGQVFQALKFRFTLNR